MAAALGEIWRSALRQTCSVGNGLPPCALDQNILENILRERLKVNAVTPDGRCLQQPPGARYAALDIQRHIGVLGVPNEVGSATDRLDALDEIIWFVTKHLERHAAGPHLHTRLHRHLK